ncbi:MAG TPA: archease [Minicystis sp.]|nr:archease [Minicystis sp.]
MYRFEEHTSEVALRIEAPTLAGLYGDAARALAALQLGDVAKGPLGPPERVVACARDRAALLVAFLDELIYRSETEKRVFPDVTVERCSDVELEAVVRGVDVEALATAVKAATYHGVSVEADRAGYTARVILDV